MVNIQQSVSKQRQFACFVITEDATKVNVAKQNFEKLGFHITQIDPVYLHRYPDAFPAKSSYFKMRRKLVLAELGCANAHLNAYKAFLDTSADYALILENDAILQETKIQHFQRALESLTSYGDSNLSEPLVFSFLSESALISHDMAFSHFYSVIGLPSQTVAYVMNRRAADQLSYTNRNLEFVADWPKSRDILFYLNIENCFNHGSSLDKSMSLIEASRTLAKPSILSRFLLIARCVFFVNYFTDRNNYDSIRDYTFNYVTPLIKWWLARICSTQSKNGPHNLRKVKPLISKVLFASNFKPSNLRGYAESI